MDVFRCSHVLGNPDVNMHMKLKTSSLFTLLQQAASEHCLLLGYGSEYTMNRGFLWVITRQKAEFISLPGYEEEITIETWPGPTRHVIYPRYYRVLDKSGNVLINASSVWTLIDANTRTVATYDRHGIRLDGTVTGNEITLPRTPAQIPFSEEHEFVVPYSYLDINGHMNNTRYLDLAEDLIESPAAGDRLKALTIEYSNEVLLNETIKVSIGKDDKRYYVCGDTDKHIFKIFLDYSN